MALLVPSLFFHFDHHIVERYPEHSHFIQGQSHTHSSKLNHFHQNDSVISVDVFVNTNSAFMGFGTWSRYMGDMRIKPQKEPTKYLNGTYGDIDEPIILFLHPELPPPKIFSKCKWLFSNTVFDTRLYLVSQTDKYGLV